MELLEGESLRERDSAGRHGVAEGGRDRRRRGRRTGGGPRQGHHPPRSETREHLSHHRRPGEDPRLRARAPDSARRRRGRDGDHGRRWPPPRAPSWAPSATCRRSRPRGAPSTPAAISSASARSSTRCWPAGARSRATPPRKPWPRCCVTTHRPLGGVDPRIARLVERCLRKDVAEQVPVGRRAEGGHRRLPRSPAATPRRPSIAVLPFHNMSGAARTSTFARG